MGKIGFRVSVDDNGVPKDIKKSIERGVRKATKRLAKRLKEEAEAEIRRKEAADSYGIWEGDLVGGFQTKADKDGLRVWNDDEAAWPMEEGVKPGAFGARGPPIRNLLPWVQEHFPTDTSFDPWGIGGGENFDTTRLWSPERDGSDTGATSGSRQRFTLPEGNRTQTSEDAVSAQSGGSGGTTKRGVEDIKPGDSYYARQGRLWEYGEVDSLRDGGFEDTLGRRFADDEFVEYAPDDLDPDSPDLSGLTKGDTLRWEFDGDTYEGVVTDPDPDNVYVEVQYDGLPHFIQRELVTDFEEATLPSWVPDSWFQIPDDEPWDLDLVYYGQEVALWDVNNAEYLRAYVRDFNPQNIEVDFAEYSGGTRVHLDNRREYRLVAGERWEDLTRAEQMVTLEDYWDAQITSRATLDPARLDFVKDHLFGTMFPRFKNTVALKRTLHMLNKVEPASQPSGPAFRMGAISPRNNGIWNFNVLKKQDYDDENDRRRKILKQQGRDTPENLAKYLLGPYEDTINHEFTHAVVHAHRYEMGTDAQGLPAKTHAGITEVRWADDGTELEGGPVSHAKHMMFRKADEPNAPALGFTRWNQYSYNNALGLLLPGMDDPGWETNEAGTLDRLVETVNRAWWKQSIWGQDEYWNQGNKPDENHLRFLERDYSAYYSHETIATFSQMMMAEDPTDYDYLNRLEVLDEHYPWLLEEWLKHFEPQGDVADKLEELGYDV